VGNRWRGPPCFLLDGDLAGKVPIGSPLLFGHFLRWIRYSLSLAEKVSITLWTFLRELTLHLRYSSNGLQEILGTFPNVSQHRFGRFLYISLEAACLGLLGLK
jgi:hypothetical protein